ncbi:hypothetical protein [Demequina sp.]|uniref:hypothetical protein n=1 Tax=Demequina sp. TaxID=2050685 RepID=UPI003A854D58
MTLPTHAAAPGAWTTTEGGAKTSGEKFPFSLPMSPEVREAVGRRNRRRAHIDSMIAARALDRLLDRIGPEDCPRHEPCTFGLTADQRRTYAAHLLAHGWQPWEVQAVLARPEVAA